MRTSPNISRRSVLLIITAVLALYAVIPQIGYFKDSWHYLGRAEMRDVLLAAVLAVLSYFAAGGTYALLAMKPLAYLPTVLIQLASMFANRLLPAGLGSIGVNFAYLKRRKHSTAQAATVVAVNNVLGLTGHLIVLLAALLLYGQTIDWRLHLHGWYWAVAIISLGAVALAVLTPRIKNSLRRELRQILVSLLSYRQRSVSLLGAQITSIALTLCNVLSLYFCAQAVGSELSVIQVLLAFTFGIALGAATPTPGGLGGVEGGIVAGFLSFHASASLALAAVLLYRLFNFWLALAAGSLAFIYASRRRYI